MDQPPPPRVRFRISFSLAAIIVVALAGAVIGYYFARRSHRVQADAYRQWAEQAEDNHSSPKPWVQEPVPALPKCESAAASEVVPTAFALPAASPLRISWPLDVGPDEPGQPACLRARQGINEIQNPGEGKALYPFRITKPGRYRSFLRARWLDDGVGSFDCNNSFFAAIDDQSTMSVSDMTLGWHWLEGPAADLEVGLHWFRVELREDGAYLDRIALIGEGAPMPIGDASCEKAPLLSFANCAGARPPTAPQTPIAAVELEALPSGSIVIGNGHVNELTILATYQNQTGEFRGRIEASSATVPGLILSGEPQIVCSAEKPYARSVIKLVFPPQTERRSHLICVSVVSDTGERLFRKEIGFFRPPTWAFLGPFPDRSGGDAGWKDPPDADALARLARLCDPAGLEAPNLHWKVIEDGSCYDELGTVDLLKVFGHAHNVWAYAVTWLQAELPPEGNALRHRSFSFQADDTASLWINNRLVTLLPVRLPKEANRLWSSASLQTGLNPVVIKIAQGTHYWGFRLDVVDWHWQGRRGDVIRWPPAAKWPQ
jgi:hypothetical protein